MDPGGCQGGHGPPALYKQVMKKMATKGGHIDFMFLGPPFLATGCDAGASAGDSARDSARDRNKNFYIPIAS